MAKFIFILLTLFVVSPAVLIGTAEGGSSFDMIPINRRTTCRGSIAECMAEVGVVEDEFPTDSEVNRRILATSRYIGYGALLPGIVPCPLGGAPYYNCRPGAQANPYRTSCNAITQCRARGY